ncbi:MAG: hypothetical protein AB1758_10500 [Candidatus Eremiobacterota bacterium]
MAINPETSASVPASVLLVAPSSFSSELGLNPSCLTGDVFVLALTLVALSGRWVELALEGLEVLLLPPLLAGELLLPRLEELLDRLLEAEEREALLLLDL